MWGVYEMSMETGYIEEISDTKMNYRFPTYVLDSSVLTSFDSKRGRGIALIDKAGGLTATVIDWNPGANFPTMSPDMKTISFTSQLDIFRFPSAGGLPTGFASTKYREVWFRWVTQREKSRILLAP